MAFINYCRRSRFRDVRLYTLMHIIVVDSADMLRVTHIGFHRILYEWVS
jgi:hypothetical protein